MASDNILWKWPCCNWSFCMDALYSAQPLLMIRPGQSNFRSAFFNAIMSSRLKCENIGPLGDAGFDFNVRAPRYQSDMCSANQKHAVSHGWRVLWNILVGMRVHCSSGNHLQHCVVFRWNAAGWEAVHSLASTRVFRIVVRRIAWCWCSFSSFMETSAYLQCTSFYQNRIFFCPAVTSSRAAKSLLLFFST